MSEPRHGARPRPLDALGRVHLVGVGGAGMSVVAALLAARGLAVSGSDARPGPVLDALAARGVVVHVGHTAGNVAGVDTVVVSSAIRPDNPELAAARSSGTRVLHRSEALAALMADRDAVAVAGAHGKTTTSAMVAVTLEHAGLDPSYAIGGTVIATGLAPEPATAALGGARHGGGTTFVAEADESDGSFLAYAPRIAVVTNVEPDHLDHYGSVEAFEEAFAEFARRVVPGGALVVCGDDPGARRLGNRVRADGGTVLVYGTVPGVDVRLEGWSSTSGDEPAGPVLGRGRLRGPDGEQADLELAVPGLHNALNATAAWAVSLVLGVDAELAARGLATFRGTGRRFEARGAAGGVRVVDDYAHHPTEVRALIAAARGVAGHGRLLVLFQPHLFSRTATFATEFAEALDGADEVVVTDVYAAREDPVPGVTGAMITERMVGRAQFVADRHEAASHVGRLARPGDLVLTVGAGDVTDLAPDVLEAVVG